MKKNSLAAGLMAGLLLTGCKSTYTVGKDISASDIKDFYYTYSNINYNAFYQRYRFYPENGNMMFFHETRKRENDYGPTTEEDTTLTGTSILTDDEWKTVYVLLSDGTVTKRKDDPSAGGSGPWLYLYWTKDKDKYQVFEFSSQKKQADFVTFCENLAMRDYVPSSDIDEEGWYVYPVTASSDSWDSLSYEEKIKACRIPEDTLSSLSDPALVKAVADYPLLDELYEYDDPEYVIGFFPDDCAAYQEILNREDPAHIILSGLRDLPSFGNSRQDQHIRDTLGLLVLFDERLDGSFTEEEAEELAELTDYALIMDTEEACDQEYDFIRSITFKDGSEAAVLWFADGRP